MTLVKMRGNQNGSHTPSDPLMPGLWPASFFNTLRPLTGSSLIQDFLDDTMNLGTGSIGTTLPAVNIAETANELVIEVAAPGMRKEDFKVEIVDNQLNIRYQKESRSEDDDVNHWRKEFNFQSFERSFSLPAIVESDKIEASYMEGILRIAVPKKEEARKKPARSIEIK